MVTRARVVRGAASTSARPLVTPHPRPSAELVRRVAREELEAREQAERIVAEARQQAERIVEEARARAETVAATAAREAAEAEQAKLAAILLALRAREERSAEEQLDRSVGLASVLAERLLGESIHVDPQTVAKLARQALSEAQGARTVRIDAHPDDVLGLQQHLALLKIAHVASIDPDATLQRGSLRLHTDLGTIDAKLRPQLERLAAALRDALRT
jgi:flagellar biosynthesis/type III secretory pathway protein FliH